MNKPSEGKSIFEFRFKASRTTKPMNKNNVDWRYVRYKEEELSVKEMCVYLSQGYSFTGCYTKTKQSVFSQKHKTCENFLGTSILAFDIDNSNISMEAVVKKLKHKPTFGYTTTNNGKNNKYRFRLIYILSREVDCEEHGMLYKYFLQGMKADRCMTSCVQMIGGTIKSAKWWYGDMIYNPMEFLAESYSLEKEETAKNEREKSLLAVDKTFKKDFFRLSPYDFLEKYKGKYEYFACTPLAFRDGYALLGDNYYEIKRRWYNETSTFNGKDSTYAVVQKRDDGMKRRRTLYMTGLIMRKIKPDITIEHLIYNLTYERTYYYKNADNVLNNYTLVDIATSVMEKPIEEINIPSVGKHKFKLDKEFWDEQGIDKRTAVGIVIKELKKQEIAKLYNPELTDKANLKILKKNGIKMSVKTLGKYKKMLKTP